VRLAGGETSAADAVIANVEPAALREGIFGTAAQQALPALRQRRSLSALAWAFEADAGAAPLAGQVSVMPQPTEVEYAELALRHRLPAESTIHIAAPARAAGVAPGGAEPFLCTIHAPARADVAPLSPQQSEAAIAGCFRQMAACGLRLQAGTLDIATPSDFARLFPASGGALWGSALQGWASLFERPGAATRLPGLFLAGAGVHPGAGLAMAALSGRHAAAAVLAERI
jgi:1-hydroxycarotenoid 3,4-desaturase